MSFSPLPFNLLDKIEKKEESKIIDFGNHLLNELSLTSKYNIYKRILIFTQSDDFEAEKLGISLLRRGIVYHRLNIDRLPIELKIGYIIDDKLEEKPSFTLNGQELDTKHISIVLVRREILFVTDGVTWIEDFSEQQCNHILRILINKLNHCYWINDYEANSKASNRANQLSAAVKAGFEIPSTLITNDLSKLEEFYYNHRGSIIFKVLHHHGIEKGNKIYNIYSQPLSINDIINFKDIRYFPSIFQEKIIKIAEVRITIIEEKVFAIKFNFTSLENVDIHRCNLKYIPKEVFELDEGIKSKCKKILGLLDITYAAIDLIIDRNDNVYFLELNPTGDWYWIESVSSLEITEAITDTIATLLKTQ